MYDSIAHSIESMRKEKADLEQRTHRQIRIFISYCREDSEFTKKLIRSLRNTLGGAAKIWFDEDLTGGERWWPKIRDELAACDICIAVRSRNARTSKWVNTEIDLAIAQMHSRKEEKKTIIPVVCKPMRKERIDLNIFEKVSFFEPKTSSAAFSKLLQIIRMIAPAVLPDEELVNGLAIPDHPTIPLYHNTVAYTNTQDLPDATQSHQHEAWLCMNDEIDTLVRQHPEAMTSHLYRLQGLSHLYIDETQLAQDALACALELTRDAEQRLALLDEYTALCITQQQWEEVLVRSEEALTLALAYPVWRPVWHMARNDALKRLKLNRDRLDYPQTRQNENEAGDHKHLQVYLEEEKETHPSFESDELEINTKAEGRTTIMNEPAQKDTSEGEHLDLALRRGRLEFERERILSALQTSVLCAEKLYPDVSEKVRATVMRDFFLQFLSVGERQNLQISLPSFQIASEEVQDRVC